MYKIIKRFLDITLSLIVLIVLSPILIPITFILRFSAEGYVFYYQERIGYKQKKFKIIKFATMLKDSPNLGTGVITLLDDWRVTKPRTYSSGISAPRTIFFHFFR